MSMKGSAESKARRQVIVARKRLRRVIETLKKQRFAAALEGMTYCGSAQEAWTMILAQRSLEKALKRYRALC